MYNKRNNITVIMRAWEIEAKVYSAECNTVCVVVFLFFRSFSRFLSPRLEGEETLNYHCVCRLSCGKF